MTEEKKEAGCATCPMRIKAEKKPEVVWGTFVEVAYRLVSRLEGVSSLFAKRSIRTAAS